jgi:hypothetical protein
MPLLAPTLTLRARGAAPADLVWERYVRLERWPHWSPQITGVDADGEVLRPGLRGVVRGWFGVGVPFVVTAVDEIARTWSWRVRVGPLTIDLTHGVEADPAGSCTWLRVRGLLPAVAGYAPLALLALRRLVRP